MKKQDKKLRKAKERYPLGTKYIDDCGCVCTVKGELVYYNHYHAGDQITDGYGGNVWCANTGFAKIVYKLFIIGEGGISIEESAKTLCKALKKFNKPFDIKDELESMRKILEKLIKEVNK